MTFSRKSILSNDLYRKLAKLHCDYNQYMTNNDLMFIYNNLKYHYNNINMSNIKKSKLSANKINIMKDKLIEYYKLLVDENIDHKYDYMKELNKIKHIIKCTIYGLDNFVFYFYISDRKLDISFIMRIFYTFHNHIIFIKPTVIRNRLINNEKMIIHIFPNDIRRELISQSYDVNHIIKYKQTNKAFTTSGMTSINAMLITKKEELVKLFLHELIHLYKLDGNQESETRILENIKQKMPFQDHNSERECVAEALSNIYNCMFITIQLNMHIIHDESKMLNRLLCIEREYSIYLVAKILRYFNVKPHELFDYGQTKKELNSPINLYCVFRSIILCNMNLIMSNRTNKCILDIDKQIYVELINTDISYFMNKLNAYYNNIDFDDLSVSYTCLDLNIQK